MGVSDESEESLPTRRQSPTWTGGIPSVNLRLTDGRIFDVRSLRYKGKGASRSDDMDDEKRVDAKFKVRLEEKDERAITRVLLGQSSYSRIFERSFEIGILFFERSGSLRSIRFQSKSRDAEMSALRDQSLALPRLGSIGQSGSLHQNLLDQQPCRRWCEHTTLQHIRIDLRTVKTNDRELLSSERDV